MKTEIRHKLMDPENDPHAVCVSHELSLDTARPIQDGSRVPLPIPTWNRLRMIATQNFDQEMCGLIDSRYDIHYITNIAINKSRDFMMHPQEYARTIQELFVADLRILGVFHTHPGGLINPSANDLKGWPNPKLNWRYFIATQHDVYEWEYRNQP